MPDGARGLQRAEPPGLAEEHPDSYEAVFLLFLAAGVCLQLQARPALEPRDRRHRSSLPSGQKGGRRRATLYREALGPAATGCWQNFDLAEIIGNIYGRANAPWLWLKEVVRWMHSHGFVSHSLDLLCFLHYDAKGILDAVVLFHVDDTLSTWRSSFDMAAVRASFEWGSWKEAPAQLVWVGREIAVMNDRILVTQTRFTLATEVKSVRPQDVKEEVPLTPEQKTEFRSCTGSLQYLSSNVRPDPASGTSLIQGSNLTSANLHAAYQLISYARLTAEKGISISALDLSRMMVVGYDDSSWANAEGNRFQTGTLIAVTTTEVRLGRAPASVVDWRSTRTKRFVRSTLAAEAIAADTAADGVYYVAAFFEKALFRRRATAGRPTLPCVVRTDCRSLYDAVLKVQATLEEKRTLIDLLSIKETVGDNGLRWIPTNEQHADPLTKKDRALLERFTEYLQSPYVALKSDEG